MGDFLSLWLGLCFLARRRGFASSRWLTSRTKARSLLQLHFFPLLFCCSFSLRSCTHFVDLDSEAPWETRKIRDTKRRAAQARLRPRKALARRGVGRGSTGSVEAPSHRRRRRGQLRGIAGLPEE